MTPIKAKKAYDFPKAIISRLEYPMAMVNSKAMTMDGTKEKKALSYIVFFLLAYAVILAVDEVLDPSAERRDLKSENGPKIRRTGGRPPVSDAYDYNLDPKLVEGKSWQDARILRDGTYLIFTDEFKNGNYCETVTKKKNSIKRIHLYAGTCKGFDSQFGNRLATLYGIKAIASAIQVPTYFTCETAEGEVPNGAAYLMKLNSYAHEIDPPPKDHDGKTLTVEEVCNACYQTFCTWRDTNLDLAVDSMVSDWNRLADPSLVPITDHDDAVIHLRLGDALVARFGRNEFKGVFPHATYINLLKQAEKERGRIRSIGVVTAPFKGSFVRSGYDTGSTDKSEMVAMDFLQALQRAFPQAKIRLLNSPKQTIVESLVRLVQARKVAVCGCSTFCPYPLLASKGIGYVYNPMYGQNLWVKNAAKRSDDYRLFDAPMLNMLMMENLETGHKLSDIGIMSWMRAQTPSVGNIDITEHPTIRIGPQHKCNAKYINTDSHSQPRRLQVGLESEVPRGDIFRTLYLDDTATHVVWNTALAFEMEKLMLSGQSLSPVDHPHAVQDVELALQQTDLDLTASRVAVISHAVSPWAEYVLKSSGASSVTSIDYNEPVVCGIDWIEPMSASDFGAEAGQYDLLVSYTGLDSFGLGKYGDPLNEDEDFEMIMKMHKSLRQGGFLLLSIPTSTESYTVRNFYRVYSSEKLALLLRHRFEFVARVWQGQVFGGWSEVHKGAKLFPHPDQLNVAWAWKHRQVLVLRKE